MSVKRYKKFPGVRGRISKHRKMVDGRSDESFSYRFKSQGKDYEKVFGWRSEGWTPEKVFQAGLKWKERMKAGDRYLLHKDLTLTEFWKTIYFPEIKRSNKESTIKDKALKWEKILEPEFGHRYLKSITAIDLERFRQKRLSEGKQAATLNRDMALLRHMFNRAKDLGYLSKNPATDIKPLKENNDDKWGYLESKDDLQKILDQISPNYTDLIIFLVYTGIRLGAALKIKWKEVDLNRGVILHKAYLAKSQKNDGIPMHEKVRAVLKERHHRLKPKQNDRIFIHSDSNFRKDFKQALNKAGLPPIRVHDLRHTFASWLVQQGVPIATVRELLCHSDLKTTMRYSHLAPQHLSDAINKI